ncbi:MAG: RNA 2',3'-cyclic phosphodiesterase [Deltaproteobacteria bacterium]|jgi:2'-5' RNA ligase|nr:RNA 2',3'-cyclic phosphodiesterase [Deltaproteobacteria bacterium]
MRLFVAINFNSGTRFHLIALRDELQGKSECGRFSAPENLHLTLAFLGECDGKQTTAAKAVVAATEFMPFEVAIERIGNFRPNLWWAGLRKDKPLMTLQRDLSDRLADAGFTLERRQFNPHITLGREVVTDKAPWRIEPFGEVVSSIELMKSERINGRLTYTAIAKSR